MTADEMNLEFNLAYNNISSNQAPELDTYEKSVYLTRVLEQYLLSVVQPSHLLFGMSSATTTSIAPYIKVVAAKPFKYNPKDYPAPIDKMYRPNPDDKFFMYDSDGDRIGKPFKPFSMVYRIASDILTVLNTYVADREHIHTVTYLNSDEIDRMQYKPYPYPPKRKMWGIIRGVGPERDIEIISHPFEKNDHFIVNCRYVQIPYPIILNLDYFYNTNDWETETISSKNMPLGAWRKYLTFDVEHKNWIDKPEEYTSDEANLFRTEFYNSFRNSEVCLLPDPIQRSLITAAAQLASVDYKNIQPQQQQQQPRQ